jgi:hypothetical protein
MSEQIPSTSDIRRIAFVTQRFLELQGLIPAALGAGLIFGSLLLHAVRRPDKPGRAFDAVQAFMFAVMFIGPLMAYLHRIYRRTFGDPVATWYQKVLGGMPIFAVLAGGMLDLLQIESGRGGPSFAAIAVATYSTYIVVRDWRWRTHHLVAVAAGLIAAAITASVPAVADQWGTDPARSAAYLLAYTTIGLGLIASGLLDHWSLASSFRRTMPDAASKPRIKRFYPNYGLTRAWIGGVFCLAAAISLAGFTDRSLPDALVLGLIIAQMLAYALPAIPQLWRAVRDFGKRVVEPTRGPTVDFRLDSLTVMFLIALAAAIESAVSPASPAVLAFAIGGASVWVAVRDWPSRSHCLIGIVASAAVLFYIPRVQPARAFAILIFATAGSVMLDGLVDFWIASRHEGTHADAI